MKNSKIAKILITATMALAAAFTCVTASACTKTSHPEAEIVYSFNGSDYTVKYTMYRDICPHTVAQFIELADQGFYDNMIIHNYTANDWYTGGYKYDAESYTSLASNGSQMAEYFEAQSKESAYVSLVSQLYEKDMLEPTVYTKRSSDDKGNMTLDKADALPRLIGEFDKNISQDFENGGYLNADYGSLKMYYYKKESKQKLYTKPTNKEIIPSDYKYNSATSLFALQASTSTNLPSESYAVFATLKNHEEFDKFVEAVKGYITDSHAGVDTAFYTRTKVRVDNLDEYTNSPKTDKGTEQDFNVPLTPIVVKSVKITKY